MVASVELRRKPAAQNMLFPHVPENVSRVQVIGHNTRFMLPPSFGQLVAAALRPVRFPGQLNLSGKLPTPVPKSRPTSFKLRSQEQRPRA